MREFSQAIDQLGPLLNELEARRRAGVRRLGWSALIGVGLAVLIGAVAGAAAAPEPVLVGAPIAAAIIALAWGGAPLMALSRLVKQTLNDRFAEAFGLRYSAEVAHPARFDSFRDHGLIPGSDRQAFEDWFGGEAHGADFELYEAHLKQRRRSKNRTYYVTVFRGVLIRISFPRTIEGVTLVTRDKGVFNAFEGWAKKTFSARTLERIGLVDPTFEKLFEVYGTDQVMARYLLTPSFMERLLKLERVLQGKNVRCVFDEDLSAGDGRGELLIAAETGNRFEAGSMFTPLTEQSRLKTLHGEFVLIDEIIETVLEPAREGGGLN